MKTCRESNLSSDHCTRSSPLQPSPTLLALGCLLMGWLLWAGPFASQAATGELDLSFNAGSRLFGTVRALAVQADGKVLVGGGFNTVQGAVRKNLARLNADGTADEGFLTVLEGPDARVSAIAIQKDGQILIGGGFTSVNGVARNGLARLHADGSLDGDFPALLADTSPQLESIVLQDDGKVLVSGGFTHINEQARPGLARLHADGSLDNSFLNGLAGPDRPAWAPPVRIAVQRSDGKIVIAGGFTSVNGVARTNVARLHPDGSLDDSFLNAMAGPDDIVFGLGIQSNGQIVIGGYFAFVNGIARNRVARLNADGSTDLSFLNGQAGVDFSVYSLVLQSDDKVLIGGNFTSVNGASRNRLARLNADGSLDVAFMNGMAGADANVGPFAVQPDGKVIIAGGFDRFNATPGLNGFGRLNSNGSVDLTFFHGPTGPDYSLYALALQPDGKIVIGGVFDSINNVPRNCLARLHPDGSVDSSFTDGNGLDDSVYGLAIQSDSKILVWGRWYRLARVNANGSRDSDFLRNLAGPNGPVQSLAIQPDGKILIGGQFTSFNGTSRDSLARLNPDGSLDGSFLAGVTGDLASVPVMKLQSDGKILIGGWFNAVNGVARPYFARLNPNGTLDQSFLSGLAGPNAGLGCLAVQPDGKIVVWGYFTAMNGVARPGLARLNADGSLDHSFLEGLTGTSGTVHTLALESDGKILLGGSFTAVNGVARQGIARLEADGSLDEDFQAGMAGANGAVLSLAPTGAGRILIGGQFTAVNQTARIFVARLLGGDAPEISVTPRTQTAELGYPVRFTVRAAGFPSPSYQWFWNGNAIPEGTNSVLRLPDLQSAQTGAYTVVVTNAVGAVTSALALLAVIPRVERRPVPGLTLSGEAGSTMNVESTDALAPAPTWQPLATVPLVSPPQFAFDLTSPLLPERFYRARQAGGPGVLPTLDLNFIPALTLTGGVGSQVRVEGINQFGPTDAWFPVATVTLTNASQLYFDVSVIGQPPRLYRLVPMP